MAFENCSFEPSGRLLESVSNYRSRWMVIPLVLYWARGQDPAYRATLLNSLLASHKSLRSDLTIGFTLELL